MLSACGNSRIWLLATYRRNYIQLLEGGKLHAQDLVATRDPQIERSMEQPIVAEDSKKRQVYQLTLADFISHRN